MAESHEVVVIGLGTAGLSACKVLDERGIDYIGLDSKKEIGKPVRSTGGVANLFVERFGMPNDDSVVAKRIRSVKIVDESGESWRLEYDHPVGLIYDFTKYENAILKNRDRVRMNTRVKGIWQTGDHGRGPYNLEVDGETGSYMARYVIDATGPISNIYMDDRDYELPDAEVIAAYEETRYTPEPRDSDVILYFDHTYAPGGYLWDFADTDGRRRIGLGVVKTAKANLRNSLNAFSDLHPEMKGDVDHTIGHQIALAPPPRRVAFGNWLIAGEAARTTFASTGGGLQMAYKSGMEAAMAVANRNPRQYQRVWDGEIRPILRRHYRVKQLMYSLTSEQMRKVVVALQSFHPGSENASREIPRAVGHVAMKLPWLIPRAMKVLI